jgi:hypothetical protein
VLRTETVNHRGGMLKSITPKHTVDMALRIKRI